MLELLKTYSITDILTIAGLTGMSLVGIVKTGEWAFGLLRRVFNKEHEELGEKALVNQRLSALEKANEDLARSINQLVASMDFLRGVITELKDSDRDAIKAYLTDKHHYHMYISKEIDDYAMDCLERRYVHYKNLGGNSFIDNLIIDLRELARGSRPS